MPTEKIADLPELCQHVEHKPPTHMPDDRSRGGATLSDYRDIDGNPISLAALVRKEPEWAASNIANLRESLARHTAELNEARARNRVAAQRLIEAVGVDGPANLEDVVSRTLEHITATRRGKIAKVP